jgi:DNA-binding response OmpR family regulator
MLLVEDDTAMRQMLESLFTGEGFAASRIVSLGWRYLHRGR